MMLLTKKNEKDLPALYANDGEGKDAKAVVKFFTPWAGWTWYVSEYDGSNIMFGLTVSPQCPEGELGYISLDELKSLKGPFGLKIERDRHFSPVALNDCN